VIEMRKSDIGVIGMAVMGKNLALNFADQGFLVSIYNRTTQVAKAVVKENNHANLVFNAELEDFVNSLEKPRKILIMVQAGKAVDAVINQLIQLCQPGDILIDGGNSYFEDTQRRFFELKAKGLEYLGLGVSGGEEGARFGPALMPSGEYEAYTQVRPMLDAVAARANGEPCSAYIGKDGSGHFVKMVHNGIEYGDMQLIAETYSLLKNVLNLDSKQLKEVFTKWNKGYLNSYLIEITAAIVDHEDTLNQGLLLDKILDVARQKGTGKWTSRQSLELNTDASVLTSAVYSRFISEIKDTRVRAYDIYHQSKPTIKTESIEIIDKLEAALYGAKMIAYAQGFDLLKKADQTYQWNLNMTNIAKGWRAGCIIRAKFLDKIAEAYASNVKLEHLLFDDYFVKTLYQVLPELREIVSLAIKNGLSMSAYSNALAYFDALTAKHSAANLIQAQRDYFGAHSFERIDEEGDFHGNW
jgi:6-phosphogluconate dehydrogenase